MIHLKGKNVRLDNLSSQITLAIFASAEIYKANGYDMTITSVSDGKHSRTSLHYTGQAVDLRIREIPESIVSKIHAEIKKALANGDYDVLLESNHIHIEYQPKLR